MSIDYLSAEYSPDRDFPFLIPSRDTYTGGFKQDNRVGGVIYSGKLDLNMALLLPDYSSVFQVDGMAIYCAAQ